MSSQQSVSASKAARPSTRRERVTAKETRILKAAREVITEYGYDGARMSDIARRAGVAEGTIYVYYRTKSELSQGVIGAFWEDLTKNAQKAINEDASALEQLEALALFHFKSLIDSFDFLHLTIKLRTPTERYATSRDHIKNFVAVFDNIFRRGVDRGEFHIDYPIWMARDLFFGTLEHSACTLVLRNAEYDESVVDNLISVFARTYGLQDQGPAAPLDNRLLHTTRRLEAAVERIEKLETK